jgi:putative RNA 2'-phosphotransferase
MLYEVKEKPLPPYLYYGTGTDFFPPREGEDIYPECGNVYVHLYDSILPAVCLGATRGKPVTYLVNSGKMAEDGYVFHHSEGRLWMTEKVPAEYYEKIR